MKEQKRKTKKEESSKVAKRNHLFSKYQFVHKVMTSPTLGSSPLLRGLRELEAISLWDSLSNPIAMTQVYTELLSLVAEHLWCCRERARCHIADVKRQVWCRVVAAYPNVRGRLRQWADVPPGWRVYRAAYTVYAATVLVPWNTFRVTVAATTFLPILATKALVYPVVLAIHSVNTGAVEPSGPPPRHLLQLISLHPDAR